MSRARRPAGDPPRPVDFQAPWIDDEDCAAVTAALRSGWLTAGPRTAEFERAFAAVTGARAAASVSSGTAALHLALVALGVGPGDEVITTPLTFCATTSVIHHVGATLVFADVEEDTLLLDPADVERRITPRTRAIIPVHLAGQPCRMDAFRRLAREHRLHLVQDCAHAIEARFQGETLGGQGDIACYSFYPTKNITTAEGGMVTTNRVRLAERIRRLRLHGVTRDARGPDRYPHWEMVELGFKYNMSDVQAALGLSQLRHLDAWWERRSALVSRYDQALANHPRIRPVAVRGDVRSAHHLYMVEVPARRRDRIMIELTARGVRLGVHYRALHLHLYYRRVHGLRRGLLPRAERASDRLVSLPLYPRMSDADQARVLEALLDVVG